jgi:hypothetical protein
MGLLGERPVSTAWKRHQILDTFMHEPELAKLPDLLLPVYVISISPLDSVPAF